jgi:RNase P subunit RPR2
MSRIIDIGHADRPVCPKCKQQAFQICDYGISEKKELGSYYFVVICKNCNKKIRYYKDV